MKDKYQRVAALSLTFSILALVFSAYATVKVFKGGGINEADFDTRVEKGIQAFIQKQGDTADAQAQRVAEKVANDIEDDDAMLGSASAEMTLVEFSDYECPFCGRFFSATLPQLKSTFIDTGKVKLVYRDFPLNFHPSARPAAIAAECAGEMGDEKYFAFHDKIFQNQTALNPENLKTWATEVGVSAAKFNECFDGQKTGEEVDADLAVGQNVGISGTPGFLFLMPKDEDKVEVLKGQELIQRGEYVIQYIETEDGERMGLRISGAHPFSTFERAINVGL